VRHFNDKHVVSGHFRIVYSEKYQLESGLWRVLLTVSSTPDLSVGSLTAYTGTNKRTLVAPPVADTSSISPASRVARRSYFFQASLWLL
jgi:hypothetical protein